ncbi:putative angiotensin-converting enzyme 2 [Rosa chinensis]|uniref:Putative angiotensin-converting enzyme 2 n=1 Tax=Rosa chinensis TaxID=74649 RepID=A0A2P6RTJ5_ROSCH|nr:uncharacterized protein LOC112187980 [Rosa chinensis]XP_024182734.1 uncharacterized protein LOC112187980 [Rosa chinensis]XP_040370586.1 uncharacterized protein LOC112187980 [Rosa chinensis]PRQ49746.1 putative angiotensin-converting enzyme 2 [Rosa chinensis]
MSSGPVRRVSRQDIQLVQNLIERCLQLYMNQKEVVETLLEQAKIEPGFTELVWQKLEEENREFFRAYYLRLMVKQQIIEYNRLLEQQARLMHQLHSTGVSSIPTSNGSHIPSMHQNSTCYPPDSVGPALKTENLHHQVGSCLPNPFTNGASSLHNSMENAVKMSAHTNRIDVPPNMLSTQSTNMGGLMQGMNGGIIKSEVGYSGTSYMYGADGSNLETRPNMGDASVAPFNSVESNSQPLNESLLDSDSSSFGLLSQIPRSFSLSDLTLDFSQSSDILESYPRSPFLAADNENFMESREREHQGDNNRLDTISEGVSYEDFGSE